MRVLFTILFSVVLVITLFAQAKTGGKFEPVPPKSKAYQSKYSVKGLKGLVFRHKFKRLERVISNEKQIRVYARLPNGVREKHVGYYQAQDSSTFLIKNRGGKSVEILKSEIIRIDILRGAGLGGKVFGGILAIFAVLAGIIFVMASLYVAVGNAFSGNTSSNGNGSGGCVAFIILFLLGFTLFVTSSSKSIYLPFKGAWEVEAFPESQADFRNP